MKITKYYLIEIRHGDDNDQSIAEIIIPCDNLHGALGKLDGYIGEQFISEDDDASFDGDDTCVTCLYYRPDSDIPYHADGYIMGEYETLADAERNRCKYRSYWGVYNG